MRRAASRYADVKVPLKGDKCTAYSFDNKESGFFNEREALCDARALEAHYAGRGTSRRRFALPRDFQRVQEIAVARIKGRRRRQPFGFAKLVKISWSCRPLRFY